MSRPRKIRHMPLLDYSEDARGAVRSSAPDTSHEAADSIAVDSGRCRAIVFSAFVDGIRARRLTDHDIYRITKLSPDTARARRWELVHKYKKLRDSGERVKVAGHRNRMILWEVR